MVFAFFFLLVYIEYMRILLLQKVMLKLVTSSDTIPQKGFWYPKKVSFDMKKVYPE